MTLHPHDDAGHAMYEEQHSGGWPSVNEPMPCQGCGEEYPLKHFKKHGQASNDPDEPVLCAACNGFGTVGTNSVEERRENNRELTDFA